MRFSLKWALAAMAYVALAAAAIAKPSWEWTQVLRTVAVIATGYAILLAFYVRGEKQGRALGFALFAVCYLACTFLAPESTPTTALVDALLKPATTFPAGVISATPPSYPGRLIVDAQGYENFRAANAIGAMAAGFIGGGLGALAYRRGRR